MTKSYRANGKLLLTAEYTILDGAIGLGLPTQKGQILEITPCDDKKLHWKSFDHRMNLWYENSFEITPTKIIPAKLEEDPISRRLVQIFNSCLEKQLILKGVLTLNDWRMIEPNLFYEWQSDSHFSELKEAEMLNERLSTLQNMNYAEEIIGTFYSKEFIRKRILKQTDEDVKLIDKQIEAEAATAPEEEEESFVPKQDKFIKEDIKLKKEMNEIMKGVLSES